MATSIAAAYQYAAAVPEDPFAWESLAHQYMTVGLKKREWACRWLAHNSPAASVYRQGRRWKLQLPEWQTEALQLRRDDSYRTLVEALLSLGETLISRWGGTLSYRPRTSPADLTTWAYYKTLRHLTSIDRPLQLVGASLSWSLLADMADTFGPECDSRMPATFRWCAAAQVFPKSRYSGWDLGVPAWMSRAFDDTGLPEWLHAAMFVAYGQVNERHIWFECRSAAFFALAQVLDRAVTALGPLADCTVEAMTRDGY